MQLQGFPIDFHTFASVRRMINLFITCAGMTRRWCRLSHAKR